ncbi:hypothetical protein [Streptomyces vinaceus]|uniref:hypothetical protein n=1 Tax=Streptomyces vinaceus TaxID=1960 RepID=UPI0036B49712
MSVTVVVGRWDIFDTHTPPEVTAFTAIPAGITVHQHLHTDFLVYGPYVSLWDQRGEPINIRDGTSARPSPNDLVLHKHPALESPELLDGFSGQNLLFPGRGGLPDSLRLCHGAPGVCPGSSEQVWAGMKHDCDGILGLMEYFRLYGDVHLIASPDFRAEDRWGLSAGAAVSAANRAALDSVTTVRTAYYKVGGGLLLLSRHEDFREHRERDRLTVALDESCFWGDLTIHQANSRTNSPAIVIFGEYTHSEQDFMRNALAPIWDDEIVFATEPWHAEPPATPSSAPRRFQTEPAGEPGSFDAAAAYRTNQKSLGEASPSTRMDDPRNNNSELHYRLAGGMLLIDRRPDFAYHRKVNRRYVREMSRARTEDASTGSLFVHMPDTATHQEWRVDVAPDTALSQKKQHLLRIAIRKLGAYEVTFSVPLVRSDAGRAGTGLVQGTPGADAPSVKP